MTANRRIQWMAFKKLDRYWRGGGEATHTIHTSFVCHFRIILSQKYMRYVFSFYWTQIWIIAFKLNAYQVSIRGGIFSGKDELWIRCGTFIQEGALKCHLMGKTKGTRHQSSLIPSHVWTLSRSTTLFLFKASSKFSFHRFPFDSPFILFAALSLPITQLEMKWIEEIDC